MQNELILGNLMPKSNGSADANELLKSWSYVGIDFGTSTTTVSYLKMAENAATLRTEVMPLKQPTLDGGYV